MDLAAGDIISAYFDAGGEGSPTAGSAFVIVGGAGQEISPTKARSLRKGQLPTEFALSQNYPNPASATTTKELALPHGAHVRLEVYDVTGRLVARVVDRQVDAGFHSVSWDCTGLSGQRVSPGVYMYRMTAGLFRAERKLVLMP